MATTTVRLSDEEEALLDQLAEVHGGRSGAIRYAVKRLGEEHARRRALSTALADWEAERGPVDEDAVAAAIERFGLTG